MWQIYLSRLICAAEEYRRTRNKTGLCPNIYPDILQRLKSCHAVMQMCPFARGVTSSKPDAYVPDCWDSCVHKCFTRILVFAGNLCCRRQPVSTRPPLGINGKPTAPECVTLRRSTELTRESYTTHGLTCFLATSTFIT
ncbi:unnamed protein product [Ectocarpus sp. 12 AP-2014]